MVRGPRASRVVARRAPPVRGWLGRVGSMLAAYASPIRRRPAVRPGGRGAPRAGGAGRLGRRARSGPLALNHHDVWSPAGGRSAAPSGCRWSSAATRRASTRTATRSSSTPSSPPRGGPATRRSTPSARCSPSCTRARWPSRSPSRGATCVPKPAEPLLGRGRLPADRLAHRLPDAVHQVRACSPAATVLVQGAGGGVATALIVLGRAAGCRVWVTSRSEAKRGRGPRARRGRRPSSPVRGCPSGSTP